MAANLLEKIDKEQRKEGVTAFRVGDAVKVHAKIREGGKERVQVFAGTVIGRRGRGNAETFTVRRIAHGVGVERVFPVQSPHIAKIEVESSSRVRRAKLYYLRDLTGKKTRLRDTRRAS
jgi:large subunit ribosomal protein L19